MSKDIDQMDFRGRSLVRLWFHCLRHGHQMCYLRDGMYRWAPSIRFCWQCYLAKVGDELGPVPPQCAHWPPLARLLARIQGS